jgi:hypothetical protein
MGGAGQFFSSSLHRMDAGSIVNLTVLHAVSIFTVEDFETSTQTTKPLESL